MRKLAPLMISMSLIFMLSGCGSDPSKSSEVQSGNLSQSAANSASNSKDAASTQKSSIPEALQPFVSEETLRDTTIASREVAQKTIAEYHNKAQELFKKYNIPVTREKFSAERTEVLYSSFDSKVVLPIEGVSMEGELNQSGWTNSSQYIAYIDLTDEKLSIRNMPALIDLIKLKYSEDFINKVDAMAKEAVRQHKEKLKPITDKKKISETGTHSDQIIEKINYSYANKMNYTVYVRGGVDNRATLWFRVHYDKKDWK